jgi:hypothetical protein
MTLGSVPVKLHDCNGESEGCNAEAEWIELDSHGIDMVCFE